MSFLNKIYTKKNINCELQKSIVNTKDKQDNYIWKRKNYLRKLNRTAVNSKPNEVTTFLDRYHLAILSEVYL